MVFLLCIISIYEFFTICFFLLMNSFTFHYETVSLGTHTYWLAPYCSCQVKRGLGPALFCYLKTVCCYPGLERFLDLFCCPIIPVCRHQALYALVRPLEVVVVYEMGYALTCFTHVYKYCLLKHFSP
jgi:hypothetical protein